MVLCCSGHFKLGPFRIGESKGRDLLNWTGPGEGFDFRCLPMELGRNLKLIRRVRKRRFHFFLLVPLLLPDFCVNVLDFWMRIWRIPFVPKLRLICYVECPFQFDVEVSLLEMGSMKIKECS